MNMGVEELVESKAREIVAQQSQKIAFDHTQSPSEQAKAIVDVLSTQKAVEDEKLVQDITNIKKEELKTHAEANLKKGEAESKKSDIELQEANYGVYSGVANYAGIKKPLPQNMQKILFTILSVFQTIFLIIFGLPISVVNMCADGIDSIVKKLGSITKSAMWIVLLCLSVGAVVLVVYLIKFLVGNFN